MIVDTMTDIEVTREIHKDYRTLIRTSLERINEEYIKERKKKEIADTEQYSSVFEICSKEKNKWMIFLSKAPSDTKFQNDPSVLFLTYHFGPEGLRVFKMIDQGGLLVFTGDFFERYNEHMELNINEPLERVKHFFANNGYFRHSLFRTGSPISIKGECRNGFLLGTLENEGRWILFRTFIPYKMLGNHQNEVTRNKLQKEIEQILNEKDFDKNRYNYLADLLKGLTPE